MSEYPEPHESSDHTSDEAADRAGDAAADGTAGDAVGSAAEEALKLVAAFTEWTRDHAQGLGAGPSGLAQQAAAMAKEMQGHLGGSEECRYCPFCRALNAVRETDPEVKQHLSNAAGQLMQAAAAFLEPPQRTRDRAGGDTAGTDGGTKHPGAPEMEHIDLDDPEEGP